MNLDIQQILTQIVAFLIMFWFLKRFAWKPLLNLMEERKRLIQAEFKTIEEQKKETKELQAAYQNKLNEIEQKARAVIQEAADKGHQIAYEIERQARERSVVLLNQAQGEIEKEMAKAKDQLKREVIQISLTIAQKIIQENLDQNKYQQLVENAIKQTDFK